MMHAVSTLFCAVFPTLFLVGAVPAHADQGSTSAEIGLLWKVERPDVAPSHIFATIHSEDPRVTALPAALRQALDEADQLALEIAMDGATLTAVQAAMFFGDGRKLSSVVTGETFQAALAAMADYGVPEPMVEKMKPWAVALTLSMPKPESGLVLDLLLYLRAVEAGKTVHGLETAEEQVSIFEDLSEKEQAELLQGTLSQVDETAHMFEALHQAYLSRNLTEIASLSAKYAATGSPALEKKLMRALIEERNYRMVARMLPLIEQGRTVVAIGALHLPGGEGVLSLLRQRGYRVSPVY